MYFQQGMGDCTLKASQYPLRVLSELHQLYSSGHLVDTTITLAECGTNFCTHKCVLVAAFPFFKKLMAKQQLSEEVILKSESVFKTLFKFILLTGLSRPCDGQNQGNVEANLILFDALFELKPILSVNVLHWLTCNAK